MEYIVDIEGFRLPINEFIIKELAILPVNNNNESARPFNLHGITWTSGNVPYTLLKIIFTKIFKNTTKMYVKGLEKRIVLYIKYE